MATNPIIIGNIPITSITNPQGVLDKTFGDGTSHPIGIAFRDMMRYIWNVKSFRCFIQTNTINDPFQTFLGAGGGIGDINGALEGISAVTQSLEQPEFGLDGNTQIVNRNLSTIINPLQIFGICGRIHWLAGDESSLLIDFTEILLKEGLYWPKIIINIGPNSSLIQDVTASSNLISPNSVVTLDGYSITMYVADLSTFLFGDISAVTYF